MEVGDIAAVSRTSAVSKSGDENESESENIQKYFDIDFEDGDLDDYGMKHEHEE